VADADLLKWEGEIAKSFAKYVQVSVKARQNCSDLVGRGKSRRSPSVELTAARGE
jgi:hypothetical protein